MFQKSLLGGLLVGFFVFFLFVPAFQVQATLGGSCAISACVPVASCRSLTDDPSTPPPTIEGGICIGPCTTDASCDSVKTGFGWNAAKCTGAGGVCLELPGSTQRLADTAPAATGAGLLTLADTLSNWFFAIFTVLAIIFILLAAFEFISAGGDAEKVGDARQKLIWAAIGIMVALVSKGLVPIVRSIVGG